MQSFLSAVQKKGLGLVFAGALVCAQVNAETNLATAKPLSGEDIVSQCEFKNPGNDQQSQLSITLIDKSGNERKTVYLRLWKDMKGEDSILDKMVLFTMFPPDASGAGFMRWAYDPKAGKHAEQWIYLPVLRKIRRVSVRDLSDSFLGSDLTYGDISYRSLEQDNHNLVRIDQDKDGSQYFVVVSTPKEADPQYARKVTWYLKTDSMQDCVKRRVNYYDKKDAFLKQQDLKWQKVGDAWVWDEVYVKNAQTFHKSYFKVEKVKINSGISEDWFTERRLKTGLQ